MSQTFPIEYLWTYLFTQRLKIATASPTLRTMMVFDEGTFTAVTGISIRSEMSKTGFEPIAGTILPSYNLLHTVIIHVDATQWFSSSTDYWYREHFDITDELDVIFVIPFFFRAECHLIDLNEPWCYHGAVMRLFIFHGEKGIGLTGDLQVTQRLQDKI